MKSRRAPEDSPEWKNMAHEVKTPVALICRLCGCTITVWHCADSGCGWCAECGANGRTEPKTHGKA